MAPEQETPETPAQDAAGGGQQPVVAGGGKREYIPEEFQAIIDERLKRERAKYADYEQVKAKLQQIEDAAKTDLQKAQEAKEAAEKARDLAVQTAQERFLQAAFLAEAAGLGAAHPADAYNLADLTQAFIADDGTVKGVAEQVKALVESGRLPVTGKGRAPAMAGGAGGGNSPTEPAGTLSEEERVIARKLGLSEEQYVKGRAGAAKPRQ